MSIKKTPTLNTEILFQLLVKFIKPLLICDIGTLDASHSVILRKISNAPKILAFEANPYNYRAIIATNIAKTNNIEVIHRAVSNKPGQLTFNVQKYESGSADLWKSGTSSILQRNESVGDTEEVIVDAIRLDDYLIEKQLSSTPTALWIDVEGAGHQVLEGIKEVVNNILFLQVEVETEEVWQEQKLKKEVQTLLTDYGFIEVGRGKHDEQHDLVYINQSYFEHHNLKCQILIGLSVTFYYIRKYGGHILSNILLIPILGIWRKD